MPSIPIPAHYRHLARVILDETARHCNEAELENYLEAELAGEDVQALYSRTWSHLQTCERCRNGYTLMRSGPEE